MKDINSAEIRIEFLIAPTTGWEQHRSAMATVAASVQQYADELAESIHMPIRPIVAPRLVTASGGYPFAPPYRMWINGKRCGLAIHRFNEPGFDANSIGQCIQWDLFHNRCLLVSQGLLDAVRENCYQGKAVGLWKRLSDQESLGYLRLLVQRGVKLSEALQAAESQGVLAASARRRTSLVAPVLSYPGITRLTVTLPTLTEGNAPALNSTDVSQTLKSFSVDIGIAAPDVFIISEEGLLPGHIGVRINDLLAPSFECCMAAKGLGGLALDGVAWQGPMPLNLIAFLRHEAGSLVTLNSARTAVEELRISHPELVFGFERRFDLLFLAEVIQQLVEEGIAVHNVRMILESLLAVNGTTTADLSEFIVFAPNTAFPIPVRDLEPTEVLGPKEYAGAVRNALKRILSYAFTDHRFALGDNSFYSASWRMTVILLRRELELRICELDETPFSDAEHEDFVSAVRVALRSWPTEKGPPIFLTSFVERKAIWQQLRLLIPDAVVLSYQELMPDLDITPVSRVGG